MPRRQWTLVVVPDDQSRARQVRVSTEALRTAAGGALIFLLILCALSIGFFVKEGQRYRADRLERENELLVREVEDIRSTLSSFETVMDDLARRDQQYRLIAGLEPIDGDVQLAGIGGPGMETMQSNPLWQLNADVGEVAYSTEYDLNELNRRAELLASSWGEATDSLTLQHDRWTKTPSILPADGYVSSSFSHRRWHPILNRPRPHEGIDVSAPIGTPIRAAATGRVVFAGWRGQYGRMVEIDHGYGVVTRYAHASELFVEEGERVERWQKVAEVGETGLTAGPHVHYEILRDGRPVDPHDFIIRTDALPD